MRINDNTFYKLRKFIAIEFWKNVSEEQWNDVHWRNNKHNS